MNNNTNENFCNTCVYFHNFKNLFGDKIFLEMIGTCSKIKEDHYKHVLLHSHPGCKSYCEEINEDKNNTQN